MISPIPTPLSDIGAILSFIFTLIFFIWFGSTLNAISRNTARAGEHAEQQTKLLESIANATKPPEFECDNCGSDMRRSDLVR